MIIETLLFIVGFVHKEVSDYIHRQHFTVSFLILLVFLKPLHDCPTIDLLLLFKLVIPVR